MIRTLQHPEPLFVRQRILAETNSAHLNHDPNFLEANKHYVLAFHDSTFECVEYDYELEVRRGSIFSLVPEIMKKLRC